MKSKSRVPGICKGKVEISDDFDKPLSLQKLCCEEEDETSYLLSTPNNKKALLNAINDLKNNRFIKGELIDGEFIPDVITNKI